MKIGRERNLNYLVLSSFRRRVVQVFERGARILDGSFMTQDLNVGVPNTESGSESCTVLSVSIADPYVLLRMTDGSLRLLVGGMLCHVSSVTVVVNTFKC